MMKIKLFVIHVIMSVMFSTAFAEDTIDIAAIYALTGPAAADNAASVQGVRYGVSEINERGGILGKRINLLLFDNLSTPLGSNIAALRAAKAGVAAIVGPAWSSHSIAAARAAQAEKIPMISNVATNPDVTKIGNYIFRVCFTDDFQGRVMARFARRDMNAATAIVFTDAASDYSLMLSKIFRKNFEQSGGKILLETFYKHKQEEYSYQIQQARKEIPDVLFLSGHDESGLIAKQAQDAGISSVPLGGDGWDSIAFWSKGGSELKHGYYSTHWSEQNDSGQSRAFVEKYKNTVNFDVGTALGYDAVMLLADGIRRAGSIDRIRIRQAIAGTKGFQGITGNISFNTGNDPIKAAVIMEIINGKRRYFKAINP